MFALPRRAGEGDLKGGMKSAISRTPFPTFRRRGRAGVPVIRFYPRCQRAYQIRVTFGLVLLCGKKHLATYMQTWKGSIY